MHGSLMYSKEEGEPPSAMPEVEAYPAVSGVSWQDIHTKLIALFPNHRVKESRAKFVIVDFFAEAA